MLLGNTVQFIKETTSSSFRSLSQDRTIRRPFPSASLFPNETTASCRLPDAVSRLAVVVVAFSLELGINLGGGQKAVWLVQEGVDRILVRLLVFGVLGENEIVGLAVGDFALVGKGEALLSTGLAGTTQDAGNELDAAETATY